MSELKTQTKKEIVFVFQNKGGVGKSIFTYMFAEKYKDNLAYIIDSDTTNKSITKHLSNSQIKVKEESFFTGLDESEINQQSFNLLIEKIINDDIEKNPNKNLYIIDCSATVSEMIYSWLVSTTNNNLKGMLEFIELLQSVSIKIHFCGVIIGSELFDTTSQNINKIIEKLYFNEQKDKIQKYLNFIICQNMYKPYSDSQLKKINAAQKKYNLDLQSYTLSRNTGQGTNDLIASLLEKGEGYSGLSTLSKLQFTNSLNSFNPLNK